MQSNKLLTLPIELIQLIISFLKNADINKLCIVHPQLIDVAKYDLLHRKYYGMYCNKYENSITYTYYPIKPECGKRVGVTYSVNDKYNCMQIQIMGIPSRHEYSCMWNGNDIKKIKYRHTSLDKVHTFLLSMDFSSCAQCETDNLHMFARSIYNNIDISRVNSIAEQIHSALGIYMQHKDTRDVWSPRSEQHI